MTTTDTRQTSPSADDGRPPIGAGRERQGAIYQAGVLGRAPSVPVEPALLEQAAHRAMSSKASAKFRDGMYDGSLFFRIPIGMRLFVNGIRRSLLAASP